MASEQGYYRHPTISGDSVTFVSEDDLWAVPAEGGVARRLTVNTGMVAFPVYSPDGRRVAFTGRIEGHQEIYVIDSEGGPARRLTWLGGLSQVVGWSADGEDVLFASDWRQPFMNYVHLCSIPAEGGAPKPLNHGPARAISYEPDGSGVVIGRNSGDPARWKRYRGGTAGTIWIDRKGDGNFAELIKLRGNLANPMWIGNRIYFLSDHEGCGNLYSCAPTGRSIRRHTHHEDFYVRFPSSDGRRIVFHAGADLFLFDPTTNDEKKIDITILSSRNQKTRKFVPAARYLESFDLHPSGHSLACVSRGGVHSMGLWEGAARRNDPALGARFRLARWLPDGKRIVAITDTSGEEGIAILPADGEGEAKHIAGDFGRAIYLAVAPAGADRVAMTNQRQELIVVDLKTGSSKVIERSPYDRIGGLAWSADGKWLAYGYSNSRRTSSIHIYDTSRSGKITRITRPDFRDFSPAFDPDGKYLYFLSERVFDPVTDSMYFDLGFSKGMLPMLIPLSADTVSPFSAANRAPRAPGAQPPAEKKPDGKKKGKVGKPPVTIDFEGIEDRVVAFPVPEGRYGRIRGAHGRAIFSSYPVEGALSEDWFSGGPPAAKGKLEAYVFDTMKTETVQAGITDFTISLDAKILGLRVGSRVRAIQATHKAGPKAEPDKPGRESGYVDIGRLRVAVVPSLEWTQMFREAWRLQRDQFWTPDMSGIDWIGIHNRYLPLVARVGCRAEFSDLMWEMQGELGTSHCYEMGGDYRPEAAWHQGFLGADIDLDARRGVWKITRIPRGDSWSVKGSSPVTAPGVNLREGDEIIEVGGVPVGKDLSPYERLVNLSGQEIQLTVRSRPASKEGRKKRAAVRPRTVTIKTLRSEYALRYRDWVESNRARVHEVSGGRVGYVHIPDMGAFGFSEFHRYYASEVDREGLIIDVRWNGGGNVSQLILEKLRRKRIGYDATRWGVPESYPLDSPMGPMVALTNEYAGSDGDIFSHGFKMYGLGPLIGKRTWGGVVGIWPRHLLVDGTMTTQPEFAFWFEDVGFDVENYGTDPDIEVENRPQDHAAGADPQLVRGIMEINRLIRKMRPAEPKLDKRPKRVFKGLPKAP